MPSPNVSFFADLQHEARWQGINFHGHLDQVLPLIRKVPITAMGRHFRTAANLSAFDPTSVARFTGPEGPTFEGQAVIEGRTWTCYELSGQAVVQNIQQAANQMPNDILKQIARFVRTAILRIWADTLASGDGVSQWLGFAHRDFPKTTIDPVNGALPTRATMRAMDYAGQSHELGHRVSWWVSTPEGVNQYQEEMDRAGMVVQYGMVPGLDEPVPWALGRPFLVCSGLRNNRRKAPVFGINRDQFGFAATTRSEETWFIEETELPLDRTGLIGRKLAVHGTPFATTPRAVIASTFALT